MMVCREFFRISRMAPPISFRSLLVPLHGDAILEILKNSRHTIIVENNYSGQFARYLRSETSFVPDGHIRKYDGEPFMPHHIVEAVKEQLAGQRNSPFPCTKLWSEEETQMATSVQRASQQLTMADMKGRVDPDWCPDAAISGCACCRSKSPRRVAHPEP